MWTVLYVIMAKAKPVPSAAAARPLSAALAAQAADKKVTRNMPINSAATAGVNAGVISCSADRSSLWEEDICFVPPLTSSSLSFNKQDFDTSLGLVKNNGTLKRKLTPEKRVLVFFSIARKNHSKDAMGKHTKKVR